MERAVTKSMLTQEIVEIAISVDDAEHRAQNPTAGDSLKIQKCLTSPQRVVGNQENFQLRK